MNKLIDVSFVIKEFREYFKDEVEIYNFKNSENELEIEFKFKEDVYKYKLKRGTSIERKLCQFSINLEVFEELEEFIKGTLMIKIFGKTDINQRTIDDYKRDTYKEEPKRLEVVNGPDDLQDDEKVIHELSNEEGQELNKLVDDIQADDEKEFGEEVAEEMSDDVINAEFEEKKQLDSNVNGENLNTSISNNDETLKDGTNIIEDENIAINALVDKRTDISNLKIDMPTPTPKHCEKCGQVAIELDVNNECAECAKEDVFEPGTVPNGFGQSITASF